MRTLRFSLACCLMLAFGVPATPSAFPRPGWAEPSGCLTYVEAVGEACPLPGGGFQVVLEDGTSLTTHGPDLKIHAAPDHGPGIGPGDPERAPACTTDFYQHVLYGRPASFPDRLGTVRDEIRSIIRRMNAVLNEASRASGGPTADYKVLCDGAGQIRIDGFTVASLPSGAYNTDFDAIVEAARAAGFNLPNVDYTILYDYDHASVCGVGNLTYDERLSVDNLNNTGGAYGVTFSGCWNRRTPMHENGHNQGAVQRTAPFSDLTGHCLEGRDVLCYLDGYLNLSCPSIQQFDCGFDTYFDSAPEPAEWLASNWNIGSRLNRFIAFGP